LDVRNQCSGFIYALTVADALIIAGRYQRILVVGAEAHSPVVGNPESPRDTAVLFGDAADLANTPGILNRGTTTAGSIVPREVAKSIRVYVRYFDLREQ